MKDLKRYNKIEIYKNLIINEKIMFLYQSLSINPQDLFKKNYKIYNISLNTSKDTLKILNKFKFIQNYSNNLGFFKNRLNNYLYFLDVNKLRFLCVTPLNILTYLFLINFNINSKIFKFLGIRINFLFGLKNLKYKIKKLYNLYFKFYLKYNI